MPNENVIFVELSTFMKRGYLLKGFGWSQVSQIKQPIVIILTEEGLVKEGFNLNCYIVSQLLLVGYSVQKPPR